MNSDNNTKKETDERQKRNGSYGRNAGYNTRKQVNRSKNNKYRPVSYTHLCEAKYFSILWKKEAFMFPQEAPAPATNASPAPRWQQWVCQKTRSKALCA